MLQYHFKPVMSDSESIGHGGKVVHGKLDSFSSERVGNTDWWVIIQASLYIGPNLRCLCDYCRPMDTARVAFVKRSVRSKVC